MALKLGCRPVRNPYQRNAQMVDNNLTGKQRLGLLLSFIWLSLVAMWASLGWAGFEWGAFYFLGVFPIAVLWGIFWVRGGFRKKEP
jgi:hypothetical protein